MSESEILARVKIRFDEKRNRSANERLARINSVRNEYPRIGEIDAEVSRLGIENIKKIAAEPQKADEYNNILKEKFRKLNHEKALILKNNGISQNYNDYIYECGLCSDTGYTSDGKRCRCFTQALIDEAFPNPDREKVLERECFKNFRMDFYPDEPEIRENMKKICGRVKLLCERFFEVSKSHVFMGDTGLGKTFLANCVEGNLRKHGISVLSIRAVKLFRLMEDYKFGRENDEEKLNCIYNADLLIIDDLGTENDNQLNSSFFDEIVNERLGTGKKMLITTNYSMEEMREKYSARFVSRIAEHFIFSRFRGIDIRVVKI